MTEFNLDLCNQKHGDLDRRVTSLEEMVKTNLEKLYGKIDDELLTAMKRPGWATLTLITVLSSLCVGLIVIVLK